MNSPYQYLELMSDLSKEIDEKIEVATILMELLGCYVLLTDIKKALQSYPGVVEK